VTGCAGALRGVPTETMFLRNSEEGEMNARQKTGRGGHLFPQADGDWNTNKDPLVQIQRGAGQENGVAYLQKK